MKGKRKAVSKTVRFEVFKRDKFTCQYCGAKAPDVVLHADHINPVANGGDNGIMNLVTACADCNGGKGAKLLDDRSAVQRQRAQIEELEVRREQLEMMLRWRDEAQSAKNDVVEAICDRIGERGGFLPNEGGRARVRRWLKRFEVSEILEALDEAFDSYMEFNSDKPDLDAWHTAFHKIPAIANLKRQAKERPHVMKVAYIQAILRRRFRTPRMNYFEALEEFVLEAKLAPETLQEIAINAVDWDDFCERAWKAAPGQRLFLGDQAEAERQREAELERLREHELEMAREQDAEELNDGYDDDGYDRDGYD